MAGRYSSYGKEQLFEGTAYIPGLVHSEFQYTGAVVVHTVQAGQDLGLISYIHYRTPEWWWVIAWANNILDPFLGFRVGATLTIPTQLDQIEGVLKND